MVYQRTMVDHLYEFLKVGCAHVCGEIDYWDKALSPWRAVCKLIHLLYCFSKENLCQI